MITIIADSNIAHLTDYFNEQRLGQPLHVIAMAGRDITAEIIAEHQPDALLIRSVTPINSHLLDHNDSVKFVGSATIGTDHVDQAYLANRGIAFANAAGCSKHSVAQYVLTAILTLRPQYGHHQAAQNPVKLGLIGLGNIGSTLAQYAQDLGWQVLGYDPLLPASAVNNASFEQVISQSDVISLHVPLTNDDPSSSTFSHYPTYHLIDENALAKIPTTTLLVNSARGPVIKESALLAELTASSREVVLDVFEHEPVVSAALLQKLRIATPHIAGYTLEGKLRGTQMIFDDFIATFSEDLAVQQSQLMDELLPINPYHWQYLLSHPEKLSAYYDIYADDQSLRQVIDSGLMQVRGEDFDQLRKHYSLRREWQY